MTQYGSEDSNSQNEMGVRDGTNDDAIQESGLINQLMA
jgi:hypothetical protein